MAPGSIHSPPKGPPHSCDRAGRALASARSSARCRLFNGLTGHAGALALRLIALETDRRGWGGDTGLFSPKHDQQRGPPAPASRPGPDQAPPLLIGRTGSVASAVLLGEVGSTALDFYVRWRFQTRPKPTSPLPTRASSPSHPARVKCRAGPVLSFESRTSMSSCVARRLATSTQLLPVPSL